MGDLTDHKSLRRQDAVTETICNLQFQSQIPINQSPDGKIVGRWDEISWAPLLMVATAVQQLATEFVALDGLDATIERRLPYTRPDDSKAELGDDVVLISSSALPDGSRARLRAIIQLFLERINFRGDNGAASIDFSSLLSERDLDLVYRHVDAFRMGSGGKRIAENFTCSAGDDRIRFARRFCSKVIAASGPARPRTVVAMIEGAVRGGNRGTCYLRLADDHTLCNAAFVGDEDLLAKIRDALWDNEFHSILIAESTTAGGKLAREIRDVGDCVHIDAPLFASPA